MNGKKFPRIPKNMIRHILIHRNNIRQNSPLQNTAPIASKPNQHNHPFMTAQRPGPPILPSTTFIAVKKMNIPRKPILPIGGPGIHLHRQFMQIPRSPINPNIILPHQKNLTSRPNPLLFRHNPGRRSTQINTRIIRNHTLTAPFLPINNQRLLILPINIPRQRLRLHPAIRKIIPILPPLQTKQKKRHPLTGNKRNHRPQQSHHNPRRQKQKHHSHHMPQRCHRHQIPIPHRSQRHKRVPKSIPKSPNHRIPIPRFRPKKNQKQTKINHSNPNNNPQINLPSRLHTPSPSFIHLPHPYYNFSPSIFQAKKSSIHTQNQFRRAAAKSALWFFRYPVSGCSRTRRMI